MVSYIFDTCSLIYLTKIQVKELLPKLGEIKISPTVKKELIVSPEKFPDAKILNQNLTKRIIQEIENPNLNLPTNIHLGAGDLESIELSSNLQEILVTDDKQAFNYASGRGLKPISSEIILIHLIEQGLLSESQFETALNKLATIKLLKPDVIAFLKQKGIPKKTEKKDK